MVCDSGKSANPTELGHTLMNPPRFVSISSDCPLRSEGQRSLKGYLKHWSLSRSPFRSGRTESIFLGEGHREALAGLAYFAGSRWKLALLVSEPRCGATTLLNHVRQWQGLGNTAIEAVVTNGGLSDAAATYRSLHAAFGLPLNSSDPKIEVNSAIRMSDKKGVQTVWMIDACDTRTIAIASELADRHRNLSIVASTRPDERIALSHAARKCSMRIDLSPISLADVTPFLNHGFQLANVFANPFTSSAQKRLHEFSAGVIGKMAELAESSLMLAANHELDTITADLVEATAEVSRLYSEHRQKTKSNRHASRAA